MPIHESITFCMWIASCCEDVTEPDPVLGIGSLAVEETDSISVFMKKWMQNIHVIPVNAYPLFSTKTRGLSAWIAWDD